MNHSGQQYKRGSVIREGLRHVCFSRHFNRLFRFAMGEFSAYNVLQRTKEIGIRKVLGASVNSILVLAIHAKIFSGWILVSELFSGDSCGLDPHEHYCWKIMLPDSASVARVFGIAGVNLW